MKEEIKQYFFEIFGMKPEITLLRKRENLPFLLIGNYEFFSLTINSLYFVLMVDRHKLSLSPSEIQKQGELVSKVLGQKTIYITDQLPAYQRKRLIDRKVLFIVPGKQLYLPFLGVVLSKEKKKDYKEYQRLPICAQEILLMVLNGIVKPALPMSELFAQLAYSRQTIFTALDALESFALVTKENKGRTKVLHFQQNRSFFNQAVKYLENPVRRIVGIEDPASITGKAANAGVTLLSRRTMITEPQCQEMAVSLAQFNKIKQSLTVISHRDAPAVLQLWERPPLLPQCHEIDDVSLYLSLQDNPDERIQIALDELRKKMKC